MQLDQNARDCTTDVSLLLHVLRLQKVQFTIQGRVQFRIQGRVQISIQRLGFRKGTAPQTCRSSFMSCACKRFRVQGLGFSLEFRVGFSSVLKKVWESGVRVQRLRVGGQGLGGIHTCLSRHQGLGGIHACISNTVIHRWQRVRGQELGGTYACISNTVLHRLQPPNISCKGSLTHTQTDRHTHTQTRTQTHIHIRTSHRHIHTHMYMCI